MAREERIQSTLDKFGKYLVQQSKANLTRMGKSSSKTLYDSINYTAKVSKTGDSFEFKFSMAEYGDYQDKGVRGAKSTYPESSNSPFAYKDKRPPAKAFANWVVKRGLDGVRDKKTGRFIKRQSLQYAISQSIYNKGIKATNFFSRPFGLAYKQLPPEIVQAFALTDKEFQEFIRK